MHGSRKAVAPALMHIHIEYAEDLRRGFNSVRHTGVQSESLAYTGMSKRCIIFCLRLLTQLSQDAETRIFEDLNFKIFQESMPPDPPTLYIRHDF